MASTYEALLLAQMSFNNNRPRFKGSILAATALATGTNINYSTVTEDSYSGWNAGTHAWILPVSGLYQSVTQFKWNGTSPTSAPAINVLNTGTKVLVSPNASSTSTFSGITMTGFVRGNAGDSIAVQLANAGFTTQVDVGDNNFWELVFLSF